MRHICFLDKMISVQYLSTKRKTDTKVLYYCNDFGLNLTVFLLVKVLPPVKQIVFPRKITQLESPEKIHQVTVLHKTEWWMGCEIAACKWADRPLVNGKRKSMRPKWIKMATQNMWVIQPAVSCPSGMHPDRRLWTTLKMDVAMKTADLAHTEYWEIYFR